MKYVNKNRKISGNKKFAGGSVQFLILSPLNMLLTKSGRYKLSELKISI